jgi:enamine deaminase RidA (YjgF/YER057c/UK114 family)
MASLQVRFQNPHTLPPPVGYSHLVEVHRGRLVLISGQAAREASGALAGKGDFRAQLEQVFANLRLAVEAAGGSFADIVKLNYYCVDAVPPEALPAVIEVRDRYVDTSAPPASTFVVVKRLVRPDWLVEVEATAVITAEDAQ